MCRATRPFREWKIHAATLLYANYLPDSGHIWIKHQGEWIDIVAAEARQIMAVRHHTVGWVSQFLRVIHGLVH